MENTGKLLIASLVLAFLACWPPAAVSQNRSPEGKGKEVVGAACTLCHGLGYVASVGRSKSEWKDLVSDMVGRGAPLMPDEFDAVIQYLADNFGPPKPAGAQESASSKVNVNKASAKDLETALALSAEEAERIVGYRGKKGNFHEWEDLRKVPGIDLSKMEAWKNRLSF